VHSPSAPLVRCLAALIATAGAACDPAPADDAGPIGVDAPRDAPAADAPAAPGEDAPGLDAPGVSLDAPLAASDALVVPPRATRVYTAQDDQQIVVHSLSDTDGALVELGRTRVTGGSSFMAIDASGSRGAAVLERSDEVVGLRYAPGTGIVAEAGMRRSSRGGGPTHVSLDATGGWALVANYGGGTIASYALDATGALSDSADDEAPGARAHLIVTSPSNSWALVPCLGVDRVAVLAFDDTSGMLTPASTRMADAGAGPRHLAITADGRFVYVNNELDSTLDVLSFDDATGVLSHLQTISTLPAGFSGANTTAEIAFGPGERFVYVSNRGHDSIAIFAIGADHRVEARGHARLEARRPRSFAIDPAGRFLLAGSQDDDVVVSFRIEADGSLTRTVATPMTGSPTFVGAFAIPPT